MKHKKWWQSLSFLAVCLFCVCLLGGCSTSDKFSGTWLGVGDEKNGLGSNTIYIEVTV